MNEKLAIFAEGQFETLNGKTDGCPTPTPVSLTAPPILSPQLAQSAMPH